MFALRIDPTVLPSWVANNPSPPVLRRVEYDGKLSTLKTMLTSTTHTCTRTSTTRTPSGKFVLYHCADLRWQSHHNWTMVTGIPEPMPGVVVALGLDKTGREKSIEIEPGCLHSKIHVGFGPYEWTGATGVQKLSVPALQHWLMTEPRLEEAAYLYD